MAQTGERSTSYLRDGAGIGTEKGRFVSLALADELLLIVLDFQTGKCKVPDPALGIGLSAALLSELVFSGSLVVADEQLRLGEYPPPAERLTETLFEQTRNDLYRSEITIRDWLAAHRRLVTDLVADRMVRADELRREQVKRLGRTSVRFMPNRPAEAFIRVQRLGSYLRTRSQMSAGDALLAALADLITASKPLLDLDEADQEYLGQLVPLLPQPLRDVLDATESAIVAAVRNPHF
jgi:hypothetical protein